MPDAAWLARHVRLLRESYHHWTGLDLIPASINDAQAVTTLDTADFAVVSHGTEPDPIFNYGNPCALKLFEMDWDHFTHLPSRLSAEPLVQSERDRILQRVTQHGYIDDYTGIRISSTGKHFRIRNATVWNLLDEFGAYYGQAALLRDWQALQAS
jgi:hypothetical protein